MLAIWTHLCVYQITSFSLSFELCKAGSDNRIHNLFERALTDDKLQKSVLLWRCYLAYEAEIACNASAARRVFFRAIHACPWYGTEICCRNLMFLWLYLHDCLFYHPSISSYFYVANLEQRSFICFLLHLYLILTLYYQSTEEIFSEDNGHLNFVVLLPLQIAKCTIEYKV